MRKFINVLLVLLAVAYLFEAITVGVFLDASIDISTGAYIVAALALLIWLVCVLLEGKMTQLQAIVTMAITVCNLCAMLPLIVFVIFPSWRMWVFIFLGISVGLSPYVVTLVYFPPEFLSQRWDVMVIGLSILFALGVVRGLFMIRSKNNNI